MKEVFLIKNKIKDFLAEKLTQEVLQLDEHRIYSMIRYEGMGGFSKISDGDLFVKLVEVIPEFKLLKIKRSENDHLVVTLKDEYKDKEDEILIDINRIIQMKLS